MIKLSIPVQQNAQTHRQLWADYTKAFAIWLMVIRHFGFDNKYIVDLICAFHMPVFFILSGYFDKGTSLCHSIVIKNIKQIIIPYFFFSITSLSICWVSPYIHPEIYHNGTIIQSILKAVFGMLLMEDQVRSYAFMPMGALWFLIALFEVKILFSLMLLLWGKCKLGIIPLLLCCILIFILDFPFFSLDSAVLAFPFYIIGFLLKKRNFIERIKSRISLLLFSALCLSYLVYYGPINGRVNIDGASYGNNLLLFYFNAVIGSLGFIFLFKSINFRIRIIENIGASTLTILGTHRYIYIIGIFIAVFFFHASAADIPIYYIIVLSILSLFIGMRIHAFLNKHFPYLIGKSK